MAMSIARRFDGRGRVRFQVYVNDSTAKKKLYVGTFDRIKDAEEAEYEAKRRLRLGERLKPREVITFEGLARQWRKSLVSVRPSTEQDYEKALRRLYPLIGSTSVAALTRRDIDRVVTSLSPRYAASTVRKTVVVLKMVLRMAVDHDYLDKMPTGGSRLSLPKTRKRTFEPLSRAQVDNLVACAPDYWRPLYLLLLTTGLRRAEALGLTVRDLDLNGSVLHVRHQLVKRELVDLKTDAAYRKVPLPTRTVEALRLHLLERPENELDLVFPTPEGKPVEPSNFYARVWIPTREKACLPSLRIHDCRHHVASLMLSRGRSIKYVQTVLGHATASVLLDIYAHVTPGEQAIASADMERWLSEEERREYVTLQPGCLAFADRLVGSDRLGAVA
jgi:integrase